MKNKKIIYSILNFILPIILILNAGLWDILVLNLVISLIWGYIAGAFFAWSITEKQIQNKSEGEDE